MTQSTTIFLDADFEPLMERYFELRREELTSLQLALQKKDGETLRLLGHRLKGTGTSYGMDALSEYGKAIETAALKLNFSAIPILLSHIELYLDHVQIKYCTEECE